MNANAIRFILSTPETLYYSYIPGTSSKTTRMIKPLARKLENQHTGRFQAAWDTSIARTTVLSTTRTKHIRAIHANHPPYVFVVSYKPLCECHLGPVGKKNIYIYIWRRKYPAEILSPHVARAPQGLRTKSSMCSAFRSPFLLCLAFGPASIAVEVLDLVLGNNARLVCKAENGAAGDIEEGQTCIAFSLGRAYRRSVAVDAYY